LFTVHVGSGSSLLSQASQLLVAGRTPPPPEALFTRFITETAMKKDCKYTCVLREPSEMKTQRNLNIFMLSLMKKCVGVEKYCL
jgi:hypothetical protein